MCCVRSSRWLRFAAVAQPYGSAAVAPHLTGVARISRRRTGWLITPVDPFHSVSLEVELLVASVGVARWNGSRGMWAATRAVRARRREARQRQPRWGLMHQSRDQVLRRGPD